MHLRLFLSCLVLVTPYLYAARALAGSCAPRDSNPERTVHELYAAVTRGDSAAVSRMFAPSFYAFDHGERMSATDLLSQVEGIAKRHPPYDWTVEDVDSHTNCDSAWVTYTNRHVPRPGTNVPPAAYLESVVLVWLDGGWKLRFFHSTPARLDDEK